MVYNEFYSVSRDIIWQQQCEITYVIQNLKAEYLLMIFILIIIGLAVKNKDKNFVFVTIGMLIGFIMVLG